MYESIHIRVPAAARDANRTRLRQIYGLTDGEVEIALLLACGCTLQDCAQRRRVSLTTVRTHLQSIFGKTDTHRQSELVALLLAGPARLSLECVGSDDLTYPRLAARAS